MSYGLEGKKYHIYNKEYSKDEYEATKNQLLGKGRDRVIAQYKERLQDNNFVAGFMEYGNENVDDSSLTINSSNSSHVLLCQNIEACKYSTLLNNSDNCYDFFSWGENSSFIYEAQNSGNNAIGCAFITMCWMNCTGLYYCDMCPINNSNLFGCVGLRNKEYCIFNKQYTKEEYNILVPQIIEHMKETGEWGEFFDPSLSPFGYNETPAMEYFPATKEELTPYGYQRSDYQAPKPNVEKIIPGAKLPQLGCADLSEKKPSFLQDILRYAIRCEKSGTLFRLIPQEIAFYIRHNLPLPHKHPDVRHIERMETRSGLNSQ